MVWINSFGLLMPSATLVKSVGWPSNRAISTFLSAATIIPTARSMSSFVNLFSTPICPLVSTLTSSPISLAASLIFSAAIKVWAIPVGQAVTARIYFLFWFPLCWDSCFGSSCVDFTKSSNVLLTSSFVVAWSSRAFTSEFIKAVDSVASALRCSSAPLAGAQIIKICLAAWPSKLSHSTPSLLFA